MTELFELAAPQDELGATEAGPAHMQPQTPVSQLTKHWQAALAAFMPSSSANQDRQSAIQALLTLGTIRALYWLALGQGDMTLAKEIAGWWADCAPLHGLGETIQ